MEVVTINITMDRLKELHTLGLSSCDYEVKYVDETMDYTADLKWQELKKASSKAYAKLKTREYELRH
jgi:hypothetical protein